jgi:hypothetical protein
MKTMKFSALLTVSHEKYVTKLDFFFEARFYLSSISYQIQTCPLYNSLPLLEVRFFNYLDFSGPWGGFTLLDFWGLTTEGTCFP